jgi:hypothetical protein
MSAENSPGPALQGTGQSCDSGGHSKPGAEIAPERRKRAPRLGCLPVLAVAALVLAALEEPEHKPGAGIGDFD